MCGQIFVKLRKQTQIIDFFESKNISTMSIEINISFNKRCK